MTEIPFPNSREEMSISEQFEKCRIRNLLGPQIPGSEYKLGRTIGDLILDIESGVTKEQMTYRGEPIRYDREKKEWFRIPNPQEEMSISKQLEAEIDEEIRKTMISDPFCPRCKKLEKQNEEWRKWNHELSEKIKNFFEFLKSFSCN